jgi:hypothetical protein
MLPGEVADQHDYVIALDGSAMDLRNLPGEGAILFAARPQQLLERAMLQGGPFSLGQARLASDGDFAVAVDFTSSHVLAFVRDPSTNVWSSSGALPVSQTAGTRLSTPTSAPQRHLVYIDGMMLFELVGDGVNWSLHDSYPVAGSLGVTMIVGISLSPDGLELVGSGYVSPSSVVFYSDRASLADRFGPARTIDTRFDGALSTPYLSSNCAELYFETLERVLYMKQDV